MQEIQLAPIHKDDLLYRFIVTHHGQEAGHAAYFASGKHDAGQVAQLLQRAIPNGNNLRVLEFAAGFGRVSRYAQTQFSGHKYVASDIHPAACRFVSNIIGVPCLLSSSTPEQLNIEGDFNFVFALSFFSHIPDSSFGRWLSALWNRVLPGGALFFTTHGDYALEKHPIPFRQMLNEQKGCGYNSASDQPDLNNLEYGTMITTTCYTVDAIEKNCAGGRLAHFESGVWFGLQDGWLVKRKT